MVRDLSAAGVLLPQEVTILGRAVALTERTARLLAAFWLEEIARKAGSFPEFPDFILNERINRADAAREGRSCISTGRQADAIREF